MIDIAKKIYVIGVDSVILWIPTVLKNPGTIRFYFRWIRSLWSDTLNDRCPWMPFDAVSWLDSILDKDMTVFEWGSGGSTMFFADRVKKVISVEHDSEWYSVLSKILIGNGVDNCDYELRIPEPICPKNSGTFQHYLSDYYIGHSFENYCKTIESYPDNYFDFIIVDGLSRSSCIYHAHKKVKYNGYLLLDDIDESYAEAMSLLDEWKRIEFFGPKPYTRGLHKTIVWQKFLA